MRTTISEKFDKDNKQKDFMYIAEDFEGNIIVGYIYIDKPWYSPEESWTYYIRVQKYLDNWGSSIMEDIVIDKDTIRQCNQINMIKVWLKKGYEVLIEGDNESINLKPGDEIPYSKWNNI